MIDISREPAVEKTVLLEKVDKFTKSLFDADISKINGLCEKISVIQKQAERLKIYSLSAKAFEISDMINKMRSDNYCSFKSLIKTTEAVKEMSRMAGIESNVHGNIGREKNIDESIVLVRIELNNIIRIAEHNSNLKIAAGVKAVMRVMNKLSEKNADIKPELWES